MNTLVTQKDFGDTFATTKLTVTGCTAGQPIIVVHRSNLKNVDYPVWVYINCPSGAASSRPSTATSTYHHYVIGTFHYHDNHDQIAGGANCFVVVANASTVTFEVAWGWGSSQTLYVYKT